MLLDRVSVPVIFPRLLIFLASPLTLPLPDCYLFLQGWTCLEFFYKLQSNAIIVNFIAYLNWDWPWNLFNCVLHDLPTSILKTDFSPYSKRRFQIVLYNAPDIFVAPLSLRRLFPFIGEYNIKTQYLNTTDVCFYFLFLSEERIIKTYL